MKPRPEPPRAGTRAITSLQNERVKLIRSLEMRKVRRETGLFVAEGASVLVMARDAGWKPRMLVFLAGSATTGVQHELLGWAEAAGAECLEVSEAVLGKLAAKDNPQTMLGVFEQRWLPHRRRTALQAMTLWVALEGVRDPGNLGTIIRTVDAVGAGGIVLIGNCVDPYAREAVRAIDGLDFQRTAGAHDVGRRRGLAVALARRHRRHAPRRGRGFPRPRLSRADTAADGQRGTGPVGASWPPPARASSKSRWQVASIPSTWPSRQG